jgi:hypothetical protein
MFNWQKNIVNKIIRGKLKYNYDKKDDVLYSYINKPRLAKNVEVGSGIIIRIDIKTKKNCWIYNN